VQLVFSSACATYGNPARLQPSNFECRVCMQLVFSSTCATYGNPAKLPVTEETPTLPINPYGRAKLMAEQVIRDYLAAEPALCAVIFRRAPRLHMTVRDCACGNSAGSRRCRLAVSGASPSCTRARARHPGDHY
jgi:UDP-glucose 4-epimerase